MILQKSKLPPRQITLNGVSLYLIPKSDENGRFVYTLVKELNPKTGKFDKKLRAKS
jgi:hypothetical protein